MRIAIVGTGISGLVAGYLLSRRHEVTLFEASDYIGGHTHTIEVGNNGDSQAVDTGFVVFNTQNYPQFCRLLDRLGVPSQASQMGFSVRCEKTGLEYSGASLNGLFAQRRNLIRPGIYRMIRDILRFYREAPRLLEEAANPTLEEYLQQNRYSAEFIHQHIIPMGAAVWSSQPDRMGKFPARQLIQFFANHGFLSLSDGPQWRVIQGGSRQYVERLTADFREYIRLSTPVESIKRQLDGVEVRPVRGVPERFDRVVIATHSDQALAMLEDPTQAEREILSSIPYQRNDVVLHTDASLLPRRELARASWNYHLTEEAPEAPAVTYYMNALQGLRSDLHYCVTLNRNGAIDPRRILREMVYHHPIFSLQSLGSQKRCQEISGQNRTFYCGAYWGNGFHEDGVVSALRVCHQFGETL